MACLAAGLHEGTRTFIVGLAPDQHEAAPTVAALLTAMGCATSVNGFVYGKLAGRLLPAPEPVHVSSADASRAAEGVTVAAEGKKCTGECGRTLPLTAFGWAVKARRRRLARCHGCDAARQRAPYAAKAGPGYRGTGPRGARGAEPAA